MERELQKLGADAQMCQYLHLPQPCISYIEKHPRIQMCANPKRILGYRPIVERIEQLQTLFFFITGVALVRGIKSVASRGKSEQRWVNWADDGRLQFDGAMLIEGINIQPTDVVCKFWFHVNDRFSSYRGWRILLSLLKLRRSVLDESRAHFCQLYTENFKKRIEPFSAP